MKKTLYLLAGTIIFLLGCEETTDFQLIQDYEIHEQIVDTIASMDSLPVVLFIDPATEIGQFGIDSHAENVKKFKNLPGSWVLMTCRPEPDSVHIFVERDESSNFYVGDYPYGKYSIPTSIIDSVSTMVSYIVYAQGFNPESNHFCVPSVVHSPEDIDSEIDPVLAIWLNESMESFLRYIPIVY